MQSLVLSLSMPTIGPQVCEENLASVVSASEQMASDEMAEAMMSDSYTEAFTPMLWSQLRCLFTFFAGRGVGIDEQAVKQCASVHVHLGHPLLPDLCRLQENVAEAQCGFCFTSLRPSVNLGM